MKKAYVLNLSLMKKKSQTNLKPWSAEAPSKAGSCLLSSTPDVAMQKGKEQKQSVGGGPEGPLRVGVRGRLEEKQTKSRTLFYLKGTCYKWESPAPDTRRLYYRETDRTLEYVSLLAPLGVLMALGENLALSNYSDNLWWERSQLQEDRKWFQLVCGGAQAGF